MLVLSRNYSAVVNKASLSSFNSSGFKQKNLPTYFEKVHCLSTKQYDHVVGSAGRRRTDNLQYFIALPFIKSSKVIELFKKIISFWYYVYKDRSNLLIA